MSYVFLDANGNVQTFASSVVSGTTQRPHVDIHSVLGIVPVSNPQVPGTPLSYVGSVVSGSVTAMFTSVAGVRNYLTDLSVANGSASSVLVTLKDGSTSVLGFLQVPANNTMNFHGVAVPLKAAPAQDFVYSVTPAASVLYMTAGGYQM